MFLRAFCAISLFIFACSGSSSNLVTHGGGTYETVIIGGQIWLKRNLNYVPIGTSAATNSRCYENNSDNCEKYGRLYDWATAMALPDSCNNAYCINQIKIPHRGICPVGWHIPTNADWDKLYRYADGTDGVDSPYDSPTAGRYLKAMSGWNDYEDTFGNGEDSFGFSALPGGNGNSGGSFHNINNYGDWWSASAYGDNHACNRGVGYNSEYARWFYGVKSHLFSVRCILD
jgi:uncharacterized protein (TIGR02145 family)